MNNKHFRVDYCKRGATKSKTCKRKIPKDELRIGKMVDVQNEIHFEILSCHAFAAFE